MENIRLSVIVPVYNVEAYLEKCVNSILEQTYRNLEIILIDDGSTDRSLDIIQEFAQKDSRIKVISKENGGQLSARKAGVKAATGDYIISIDSDDWINNDRFEKLVIHGLVNRPDMCYMVGMYKEYNDHFAYLQGEDSILGEYEGEQISRELMTFPVGRNYFLERGMEFSHWSWCVKREIYKDNILCIDERIRRIEDFISIFSCILGSKKITCIAESGYHYVQREGSISRRKSNWNENHSKIYFQQMQDIISKYKEKYTIEISNVAVQYCYHNIFLTNYKLIYDYYKEYLFPYYDVKSGSKIIVYGAGNIGVEMVNALEGDNRFNLVAWVDRKAKANPRSNVKVEGLDVLLQIQFDYIVIAILVAEVAIKAKESLVSMGIDENKVKLMSCKEMNMQDLYNIFNFKAL